MQTWLVSGCWCCHLFAFTARGNSILHAPYKVTRLVHDTLGPDTLRPSCYGLCEAFPFWPMLSTVAEAAIQLPDKEEPSVLCS